MEAEKEKERWGVEGRVGTESEAERVIAKTDGERKGPTEGNKQYPQCTCTYRVVLLTYQHTSPHQPLGNQTMVPLSPDLPSAPRGWAAGTHAGPGTPE